MKMKLICCFVHAAMMLALPLSMSGEEIENSDWSSLSERHVGRPPKGWIVNSKFSSGDVSILKADGGTLLKIAVIADATGPLHLYNRSFVKVTPESQIVVKVSAAGHGALGVIAYVYDEDEATLGTTPKADEAVQAVDKEAFSEFTYTLKLGDRAFRKGVPARIRLAIIASPGSEIQVRSLTAKAE